MLIKILSAVINFGGQFGKVVSGGYPLEHIYYNIFSPEFPDILQFSQRMTLTLIAFLKIQLHWKYPRQ